MVQSQLLFHGTGLIQRKKTFVIAQSVSSISTRNKTIPFATISSRHQSMKYIHFYQNISWKSSIRKPNLLIVIS